MPRRHDDNDDNDSNDDFPFDPKDYGFSEDEWEELKDALGFETDDELLEAYPDMESYSDWISELDYLDDIDNLGDDDDFYS